MKGLALLTIAGCAVAETTPKAAQVFNESAATMCAPRDDRAGPSSPVPPLPLPDTPRSLVSSACVQVLGHVHPLQQPGRELCRQERDRLLKRRRRRRLLHHLRGQSHVRVLQLPFQRRRLHALLHRERRQEDRDRRCVRVKEGAAPAAAPASDQT